MSENAVMDSYFRGDNNPLVADKLEVAYSELLEERDRYLSREARLPDELDEETSKKMVQFVKMLQDFGKKAEAVRKTEKAPLLDRGREVDAWFQALVKDIKSLAVRCRKSLTDYQQAQEHAEAERLAAERKAAERKAQEAAAIEEEAIRKQDKVTADLARMEQERQEQQLKLADARSTKPAAVKGSFGTSRLNVKIVCKGWDRGEIDLEALRHYIPQAAIDTAIRKFIAANGRNLRGAEIVEEATSIVR